MDKEVVRLSGKSNPRVLFIPTASDDSREYAEAVASTYTGLGCEMENLWLLGEDGSQQAAQRKIEAADAIYVGGGNTKKMIAVWKELGVDEMLRAHLEAGKPVTGVSAGAICWFGICNSDWPQYEDIAGVNTAPLQCLGFVGFSLCPHTAREGFRLAEFKEMMRDVPGPGVGLDDCCAIQVRGGEYRILSSAPGACAHRVEWRDGILQERVLEPHDDYRSLDSLLDPGKNGIRIASKT